MSAPQPHRNPRVVFAGTPAFAAAHLAALLEAGHEIVAVYTQPDRPAGRGKKLQPSPVKELAQSRGIPVHQPASLKSADEERQLRSLGPDVMVVVAYGLLLPAAILAIPRHGCINVHASLLPRWRGAAPIEHAILAGDAESGVTIMQMDAGLDTGDMLTVLRTPIDAGDTSASLGERLTALGRQGLLQTLEELRAGDLQGIVQDDAAATYAGKLSKQDALIDWSRPAPEIRRVINAFYPRSPAWCWLGGERVRILEAEPAAGPTDAAGHQPEPAKGRAKPAPGTILAAARDGLRVACGDGTLRVTRLQLAGKNPVSAADLVNTGNPLFRTGSRFASAAPE